MNKGKAIAAILAVTIPLAYCAKKEQNYNRLANRYNSAIEDLQEKNNDLAQEIAILKREKAQLQRQKDQVNNEIPATPIEATLKPESSPLDLTDSNARSEYIRNALDPEAAMYEVYSYIGEERKSKTGEIYRFVRIPGDDNYTPGKFNMTTLNEEIPCMTYDFVSDEYESKTGNIYSYISLPNDDAYETGIYDCTLKKVILECNTYDRIGDEYNLNGNVCREISVPDDVIILKELIMLVLMKYLFLVTNMLKKKKLLKIPMIVLKKMEQ